MLQEAQSFTARWKDRRTFILKLEVHRNMGRDELHHVTLRSRIKASDLANSAIERGLRREKGRGRGTIRRRETEE